MPKRGLEIDLRPMMMKVRLLILSEGFQRPYGTLSYCWGKAQTVRLTQDALHGFINEGVPLSELPASIREACELCNGIGVGIPMGRCLICNTGLGSRLA